MPGGREEATALEALEARGAAGASTTASPLTRRFSKRASAPAGGRTTDPAPELELEAELAAELAGISLEVRLEPAEGAVTANACGGKGCEDDEDEEADAEAEERSPTRRTLLARAASSTLSAEGVSALSSSSASSSL